MSLNRQLINPPEMRSMPGFSHVAVAGPGQIAYLAGQVALAPDLSIIGGDDLAAQTYAAMQNVKTALASVGASWENVVRRTIYTLRPSEFSTITRAIEEAQGSDAHPAQSLIGVTELAINGLLIEIEVTAHLD